MRNIRLTIEYDGTDYAGWQIQGRTKNLELRAKTIQGTIERILKRVLQEDIILIASGRTDAGVHAQGQTANFKTNSPIPLDKLHRALNSLLPDDIAVIRIQEVNSGFHARFDAQSKTYRYTILNSRQRSVFLRKTTHFYPYPLDIKAMSKASRFLIGRHDFKAFCASASSIKNTVRTIKKISIKKINYKPYTIHHTLITVDIEADGFLYNMVRSIVGTLIEVGRGKITANGFKKILASRNRFLAGPTAPANGLCLIKVFYKPIDYH